MAVTTVFGMTQSGKSFLVDKKILPTRRRRIVFDNAGCFDNGALIKPAQERDYVKLFEQYKGQRDFSLIYRPGRDQSSLAADFDKLVAVSCALGRSMGVRIPDQERILFVCDEADFVCSATAQTIRLKHLVNKGRHDNVDSLFIARDPHKIHTDIRRNSSRVISFFIPQAKSIPFFTENFGRDVAEMIGKLPKYHYFTWLDTGESFITDDKGKQTWRSGLC